MLRIPLVVPLALVAAVVSWASIPAQTTDPAFRVHVIDPTVQSETAAVADLNNDRKPDIISAESWYEAPMWAKHALRSINRASGYVDDFSDLPVDVDGDGYIDIVQIGYFARRLEWLKNPGASATTWTVHE